MSVKSSPPWRPVLSPFSTGTEKARLASTPFPGSTTALIESRPWPGSPLWPPPALARPSESLTTVNPAQTCSIPARPALEHNLQMCPCPPKAEVLDPAVRYVKGPAPPLPLSPSAKLQTTRAQDQRRERPKQQKTSALCSEPNAEHKKMDSYVGCGDPEEKTKLFQVKLCLVTPWKYIQDVLVGEQRTWIF